MDFRQLVSGWLASLIMVVRRTGGLIFFPYKTMRKISQGRDWQQLTIIIAMVYFYLWWSNRLRPPEYAAGPIFLVFLFGLGATVAFFSWGIKQLHGHGDWRDLILPYSYTLVPTLVWFIVNSTLYCLLPPPRTLSLLGQSFSVVFIVFSISLLGWKIILVFLALRFSGRLNFYRIAYLIGLYLCWLVPYAFLLYRLKLFRVPLI
ncbi:hypothetical protein M1523_02715 [Patescibacteria group bacterium]|nr:hypothetical protein [Patescibacteria group bacterium]MCL5091366.1 hypothetical protein [Patescibacteria group bacterium]